jgi:predicted Zn finger-like uncharacterized protein
MSIFTVACPACETTFPVDPDRVPPSGVRARCSVCGGIFPVMRPAPFHETPPDAGAAAGPSLSTADRVGDAAFPGAGPDSDLGPEPWSGVPEDVAGDAPVDAAAPEVSGDVPEWADTALYDEPDAAVEPPVAEAPLSPAETETPSIDAEAEAPSVEVEEEAPSSEEEGEAVGSHDVDLTVELDIDADPADGLKVRAAPDVESEAEPGLEEEWDLEGGWPDESSTAEVEVEPEVDDGSAIDVGFEAAPDTELEQDAEPEAAADAELQDDLSAGLAAESRSKAEPPLTAEGTPEVEPDAEGDDWAWLDELPVEGPDEDVAQDVASVAPEVAQEGPPEVAQDVAQVDEVVDDEVVDDEVVAPSPDVSEASLPDTAASSTDVEAEPAALPQAFQFGQRDPHDKARRLARVLVSDIITYNPERYLRALENDTLKEDLDEEIRKSWTEYVEQVGSEIARETTYWKEALNDLLARGRQVF